MSATPASLESTTGAASATGWYGKLPARGDFVSRGIEPAALQVWDTWLQRGLQHAAKALGAARFEQRVRAFAPWRWLVWPDGPANDLWAGVLVASSDRVGRAFPLLLQQRLGGEPLAQLDWVAIESALARLAQAATAVTDPGGGTDFEAILGGLGDVFETPTVTLAASRAPARKRRSVLQLLAASPGTASLWWVAPTGRTAPMPLGDAWPPHDDLLLELLGGADVAS